MDSLQGLTNKSIPKTIACPDPKPSHQWNRAALTCYVINGRRMAMDSLE